MKDQKYEIRNIESFELKDIFECGQCFRWNPEESGSYTGIVGENVLNVRKKGKDILITGFCKDNIEELCYKYFDLGTDYQIIRKKLSNIDNFLKVSTDYGKGIRILKQDVWETLISFIISANNNIPRIKGIIERISKRYGDKIIWKNKEYYTFPSPEQLSKASIKELRELGLGFRDVRVFETTRIISNKEIDIDNLSEIENTEILKEELLKFPGVGPKVADCIMLFSMKRFEVFPIDVWVKRVMTELYFGEIKKLSGKEGKILQPNNKEILKFAEHKFGKLAGLAQQYLFYWRRSQSEKL